MIEVSWLVIGIIIGITAVIILFMLVPPFPVQLNQGIANDICINLTSNETAIASSNNGKLKCEIPSFDSTHNIIIKGSGK